MKSNDHTKWGMASIFWMMRFQYRETYLTIFTTGSAVSIFEQHLQNILMKKKTKNWNCRNLLRFSKTLILRWYRKPPYPSSESKLVVVKTCDDSGPTSSIITTELIRWWIWQIFWRWQYYVRKEQVNPLLIRSTKLPAQSFKHVLRVHYRPQNSFSKFRYEYAERN